MSKHTLSVLVIDNFEDKKLYLERIGCTRFIAQDNICGLALRKQYDDFDVVIFKCGIRFWRELGVDFTVDRVILHEAQHVIGGTNYEPSCQPWEEYGIIDGFLIEEIEKNARILREKNMKYYNDNNIVYDWGQWRLSKEEFYSFAQPGSFEVEIYEYQKS
jgi:hypothetical protein